MRAIARSTSHDRSVPFLAASGSIYLHALPSKRQRDMENKTAEGVKNAVKKGTKQISVLVFLCIVQVINERSATAVSLPSLSSSGKRGQRLIMRITPVSKWIRNQVDRKSDDREVGRETHEEGGVNGHKQTERLGVDGWIQSET